VPQADPTQLTPFRNTSRAHLGPVRARSRPPGEREARQSLRRQIARLERELSDAFVVAFPTVALDVSVPAGGGARMLTLGELEVLRDALVDRLAHARAALAERAEVITRNRELLERVRLEPRRYKYFRIALSDLGEPGCGVWHVRPRLGLIGMLAGWWQVKLSSGCPLPR
jgi:hypothetical protein